MAISSTRRTTIEFTGDIAFQQLANATTNTDSPGVSELKTLAPGANTITPPANASAKAVTIIPPSGNVATITLKGVTGDTGVLLHTTEPSSISLGSTTGTFVLTVSTTIAKTRFIWS